jgi:hypothetical protein
MRGRQSASNPEACGANCRARVRSGGGSVTLVPCDAKLGRQRDRECIHHSCQAAEVCKAAQIGHVRWAAAAAQAAVASCGKGGGETEAAVDEGAAEEDSPPSHAIRKRRQGQAQREGAHCSKQGGSNVGT